MYRIEIWRQWERQEEARKRAEKMVKQTLAYIALNNLYLNIEAGREKLTVHTANDLRVLAGRAYDRQEDEMMLEWWEGEFRKLDGWLNV